MNQYWVNSSNRIYHLINSRNCSEKEWILLLSASASASTRSPRVTGIHPCQLMLLQLTSTLLYQVLTPVACHPIQNPEKKIQPVQSNSCYKWKIDKQQSARDNFCKPDPGSEFTHPRSLQVISKQNMTTRY
jgi:hypothetical protein